MPAAMSATQAPRSLGARQRQALSSGGALGARQRAALSSGGAPGAGAREALAAAGAGWGRRIRLSLKAQRLRDLRLHSHDLSLFSSNQFHIYRLDGRVLGTWPTPRWEWIPTGRGRPNRLSAVNRLDPLQLPAFDLPRYQNEPTPPNLHFTHTDPNLAYANGKRAGGTGGGYGPSSGASGAGVVGAGAAVLALAALVLLARALERCLDRRLFKLLRGRSDEWFTPNVLATSQHMREEGAMDGAECSDVALLPPGDPPPPYSLCLPKSPPAPGSAEPPPPYSACYVAFGGPHNQPTVHLNVPSFQDTGQIGSEVTHRSDESVTIAVPRGDESCYTDPAELRPNRVASPSQGATVLPNSLVAY